MVDRKSELNAHLRLINSEIDKLFEADTEKKHWLYEGVLYTLKNIQPALDAYIESVAYQHEQDNKENDWTDRHIGYDLRLNIWIGFDIGGQPFVYNQRRELVMDAIEDYYTIKGWVK